MDIQSIVAQLRQEVSRFEQAITALAGLSQPASRRGRPPTSAQAASAPKKHHMSATARARISAAQKARWKKQKRAATPTKTSRGAKKASGRKPMSPAMRKKLSALMKARWAERKRGASA